MVPEKSTILLTLHHLGESCRVQTNRGQYHSLMGLISENLPIAGFGLCGGMGSCGTCRVVVCNRNVLSCAVQVNDDLANTDVMIPDTIY